MFSKEDFRVFHDETLSGRLSLIRSELDPSFESIGQALLDALEQKYQDKFYLKIAKHQRRTKNPPPDTWLAISQDKRGYKRNPHVELGLWPDRYFVTFSLLADAYNRSSYYPKYEGLTSNLINSDWQVSNDHTSSKMYPATDFPKILKHYQQVKSSDLVIGYNLLADSSTVRAGDYDQLLFYKFMELSQFMVDFNE